MTVNRQVTVWCDGESDDTNPFSCGAWITEHDAARARRDAKAQGWKVALPGGRDLCPDHAHLAATSGSRDAS